MSFYCESLSDSLENSDSEPFCCSLKYSVAKSKYSFVIQKLSSTSQSYVLKIESQQVVNLACHMIVPDVNGNQSLVNIGNIVPC